MIFLKSGKKYNRRRFFLSFASMAAATLGWRRIRPLLAADGVNRSVGYAGRTFPKTSAVSTPLAPHGGVARSLDEAKRAVFAVYDGDKYVQKAVQVKIFGKFFLLTTAHGYSFEGDLVSLSLIDLTQRVYSLYRNKFELQSREIAEQGRLIKAQYRIRAGRTFLVPLSEGDLTIVELEKAIPGVLALETTDSCDELSRAVILGTTESNVKSTTPSAVIAEKPCVVKSVRFTNRNKLQGVLLDVDEGAEKLCLGDSGSPIVNPDGKLAAMLLQINMTPNGSPKESFGIAFNDINRQIAEHWNVGDWDAALASD